MKFKNTVGQELIQGLLKIYEHGCDRQRKEEEEIKLVGVCTDLNNDKFDYGWREIGVPHVWGRRRTL